MVYILVLEMKLKQTRRTFLEQMAKLGLISQLPLSLNASFPVRNDPAVIACFHYWKYQNIGDVAHICLFNVLEKCFPSTKLLLIEDEITPPQKAALFIRNFPHIPLVDFNYACENADILIHGSKSGTLDGSKLTEFKRRTGKPFGYIGVTVIDMDLDTFDQAAFIYTRDSISMQMLKDAGVSRPKLGWAADGTLGLTMTNDVAAEQFLQANKLDSGKFICVIPRLRKTPSRWMYGEQDHPDDEERMAYNSQFIDRDMEMLRTVIIRWIKTTEQKVLLCPETTYQLDLFDKYLIDPLPEEIKDKVVKRKRFWLPDEAASTYERARAVVSQECHFPLISFTVGTPAIYIRQPEDTHKGKMYDDMGLGEFKMETDEINGEMVAERLLKFNDQYSDAKRKIEVAIQYVWDRYEDMAVTIRGSIK